MRTHILLRAFAVVVEVLTTIVAFVILCAALGWIGFALSAVWIVVRFTVVPSIRPRKYHKGRHP